MRNRDFIKIWEKFIVERAFKIIINIFMNVYKSGINFAVVVVIIVIQFNII